MGVGDAEGVIVLPWFTAIFCFFGDGCSVCCSSDGLKTTVCDRRELDFAKDFVPESWYSFVSRCMLRVEACLL